MVIKLSGWWDSDVFALPPMSPLAKGMKGVNGLSAKEAAQILYPTITELEIPTCRESNNVI